MGLKLTEAFVDIAYFQTSAGVEITGESPTCTIYDEADNTAAGVVAEIGNGLYKCSFTPDNAGIWKLRWRLTAGGVDYGETHFFQAGQGQEADVITYVDKIDDATNGLTAIKAEVEGIGGITPSQASDVTTAHATTDGKIDVVDAFHDVPAADSVDNAVMSDVIGNKTDGPDWFVGTTKSLLGYAKAAASVGGGISYVGICDSGMTPSTTTIVCDDLKGLGDDFFNTDWVMTINVNDNSHGNAPEGNAPRDIQDYVSATGTFTVASFSANVEENDRIIVGKRNLYTDDKVAIAAIPAVNSFAYKLSRYLADGDGDFATGTVLPSNKSLYDVIALDRLDNGTYGLSALETIVGGTKDVLVAVEGTADSGTNTTLVDSILTQGDDYWNDMLLVITGGTNIGQARRISDFDAASDTLTVDTAFDAAIDVTSTYAIVLDRQAAGGGGDATAANQTLILGDIGNASAATLGSIYGILGNPAVTITAYVDKIDDATDGLTAIKAEVEGIGGITPAQASDVTTAHTTTDGKIDVVDAFHDVPGADSADNVVISDVVGNKTDTVAGNSLIALLKQIIVDTGTDIVADFDRHVTWIDCWSDALASVTITGASSDVNLSDVIIPALPTGATIWKVVLLFKCAKIADTSGSDNAVNGAAAIRIKASGGAWGVDDIVAYDIIDNSWAVDVSAATERGGDAFVGNINNDNLSGEVTAAGTYNLRLEDIAADGANLLLYDCAVGLRVYIY